MPQRLTEANVLEGLTENVRDQEDLERDIAKQADQLLLEQADERDKRRLDRTDTEKEKLIAQMQRLQDRLLQPGSSRNVNITVDIERLQVKIDDLDVELQQIQKRIDKRHEEGSITANGPAEFGTRRLPGESQREFLIRTGKITPFSRMDAVPRSTSNLDGALLEMEEVSDDASDPATAVTELLSHQNLGLPGFVDEAESENSSAAEKPHRLTKRRKLRKPTGKSSIPLSTSEEDTSPSEGDLFALGEEDGSDYAENDRLKIGAGSKRKTKEKGRVSTDETEDFSGLDDGDEKIYQARLLSWVERRREAREKANTTTRIAQTDVEGGTIGKGDNDDTANQDDIPEWFMPHPTKPDEVLGNGYRIPGDIYPALFNYQKTGVQWLQELYTQNVGGIIGDEMGLGKTIQVISFLACLHYSKMLTKPVIVVAPATLLKQWVNEFHRWWPPLRVSILHTSGSGMLNISGESRLEEKDEIFGLGKSRPTKARKSAEKIIKRVIDHGHVLVTTYAGLKSYGDLLINVEWDYAVLDEGHKIRNPNAEVTIYCKWLITNNRIILSGTPMQNNLVELWSLIDFVFQGRLGSLDNFRSQFEIPIKIGGYANASNLQVETAIKCAEVLKDTISPYLLQRLKVDVAADLPKKTEQVLFCKLTKSQEDAYKNFLGSDELRSILNGRLQALHGIDILRKICNHPDLVDRKILKKKTGYDYGKASKSGKMQVVKGLLESFKMFGHKALLFCQGVIMLDVFETFMKSLGYNYRRMDGKTSIKDRQTLVDEFNSNPDIHVFLLTVRVGGLGVNLTGADRVIIFDPDWNPSTDVQARERAWRLGQKKEVTIYRLLTSGTIEEKIYHRQIFKQFLTNKVLRDPKQRQAFQMQDLHDLFTYRSTGDGQTETAEMFKGSEVGYGNSTLSRQLLNTPASIPSIAVDLSEIAGVASVEEYRRGDEDEKPAGTDHEARIMEGIFARSGVHSALEHDKIINGRKVIQADPTIIEQEAKRIAAEAAKELKKAGEAARHVPIGTPTWTGQFGIAGRPTDPRDQARGGPSSIGVLANLQNRQVGVQNASSSNSRATTPNRPAQSRNGAALTGKEFMVQIRDFLIAQGGQARSQMLVNHFDWQCTSGQKTALFKAALEEIATKDTTGARRGRAIWKLKDEYKQSV